MSRTVILGAGFAGQYAALILRDALKGKGDHEVVVVNPADRFTYVPSLIWVSIGQMQPGDTQFPLRPVYDRLGIELIEGLATEIHPDEGYVLVDPRGSGPFEPRRIDYDYLINATGPHLNFDATPGLGPDGGHTHSICTPDHAHRTAERYRELVRRLEGGERAKMIVGTGHSACTCQGAAFEFICLVHNDLADRGLRDRVDLMWLSNEPCPGDFGIDGFEAQQGPVVLTSEDMCGAVFRDYGIECRVKSHVHKVDDRYLHTENEAGEYHELEHDFAMLMPPFRGKPIRYLDRDGNDLSGELLNPAGFLKVDAVYGKCWEDLKASDWPRTYQNPTYPNLFAAGIAFAPPGCTSKPCVSRNGTPIGPTVPRTGYTSELTGKAAALNIADMIQGRAPSHSASLAETAGMCIASMKNSWTRGSAAVIGIHPIVRNRDRYPEHGRNLTASSVEMGLAGAWLKKGLHHAFLYKLSAKPMWKYVP
ncbi:MAG: FAD-dependent oxidoreductase [Chromatiales bacterium]|jgi:sulfide:quinone oxidoreductase